MPSLRPDYLAALSFGTSELSTIHRLGEARGRQDLFIRQFPEQLETLRTHAIVESTESSNRIEGVIAPPARVADLVIRRVEPRNRSEQEIAGYRDALQLIHESHAAMPFSARCGPQTSRGVRDCGDREGLPGRESRHGAARAPPDARRRARAGRRPRPRGALARAD
jgi:hypothetical protein